MFHLVRNEVLVLVSGGIDSSALIDFYISQDVAVFCVHYQYGQESEASEKHAVEEICSYYNVEFNISNLEFQMINRKEELVFRNLIFVLASCSMRTPPLRIALAIHAGTQYYDCSRSFLQDTQRIMDGYFSGIVNLEAPFIDFTKRDIIEYCKKREVPIHLTYSCLRQSGNHCGECTPCRERESLLKGVYDED